VVDLGRDADEERVELGEFRVVATRDQLGVDAILLARLDELADRPLVRGGIASSGSCRMARS